MFRIAILLTDLAMLRNRSSQASIEAESTPKKRISQIASAENIPEISGAGECPMAALLGEHQVENAHAYTSTIDEIPLGQRSPDRCDSAEDEHVPNRQHRSEFAPYKCHVDENADD